MCVFSLSSSLSVSLSPCYIYASTLSFTAPHAMPDHLPLSLQLTAAIIKSCPYSHVPRVDREAILTEILRKVLNLLSAAGAFPCYPSICVHSLNSTKDLFLSLSLSPCLSLSFSLS